MISDPDNPANEGKVFLYKFGKKLFEKINDQMHPEFSDEEAVNPFDLWEGANFRLRIRKFEGYRNYDKSSFDSPSPLHADDEVLEKIWQSEHPLAEFTDPSTFKSYAELQAKLAKVLGESVVADKSPAKEEQELPWSPPEEKVVDTKSSVDFDDDDDSLEFFKKLASE